MIIWWPLFIFFLLMASHTCRAEPLNFDPFFGHETSFFSPQESAPFGTFSGYAFGPAGVGQLAPNFQAPFAAETSNIPIYTDGMATPPQIALSHLEKDYKSQLHRLAHARSTASNRPRPRYPKFRSEPYPSATNTDERTPLNSVPKRSTTEEPRFTAPKSQPIELHTGFTPIIKGSSQDHRSSADLASTVIKDIEPPILTAAPGYLTARPSLLTVSASVLSSSKVPPNSQRINSSIAEAKARSRPSSYSRFLNFSDDTRSLAISSSSSESVVGRLAPRPESILDLQQKDLLRLSPSETVIFEESKVAARKILDINCEGSQDLGWCELGDKYPKKYVNQMISTCEDVVERMHVELPHSFEKLSDSSDFKAELDNSSLRSAKERGSHDAWSWAAYFHQGSLCDAETGFLRPETARDSSGNWNIIVQTDSIKQRVPLEMCRKTNGSCKKNAELWFEKPVPPEIQLSFATKPKSEPKTRLPLHETIQISICLCVSRRINSIRLLSD